MKSIFKFIIYIVIILYLSTMLTFNEEIKKNKQHCHISKSYIDKCLNKTPSYSIYFKNWEDYCKNRKLKKITSMSCNDLSKEFFGY